MSTGAINGYAGLWFQTLGMTTEQIGIIFALPIIGVVLAGIPVGRLADRASDWRYVIVGGALLSAIISFALLVVEGFIALLIVWTLAVVMRTVISPVIDAAAIRHSRREDGNFGGLYAWKTVGYLATVSGTGLLVGQVGIVAFLPAFLAMEALRGLCALLLPRFRATPSPVRKARPHWIKSANRALLLPLFGWALVHCTHSILNAFLGACRT